MAVCHLVAVSVMTSDNQILWSRQWVTLTFDSAFRKAESKVKVAHCPNFHVGRFGSVRIDRPHICVTDRRTSSLFNASFPLRGAGLTWTVSLRPTTSCTDERAAATTQIETRRILRLAGRLRGRATTKYLSMAMTVLVQTLAVTDSTYTQSISDLREPRNSAIITRHDVYDADRPGSQLSSHSCIVCWVIATQVALASVNKRLSYRCWQPAPTPPLL